MNLEHHEPDDRADTEESPTVGVNTPVMRDELLSSDHSQQFVAQLKDAGCNVFLADGLVRRERSMRRS